MRKFKKGQRVIIAKNERGHGFKIGEIVILTEPLPESDAEWVAQKLDKSDFWYISEREIKPANPSLTFTHKTVKRKGKEFTRWEAKHKNGKLANDLYSTKAASKKELLKFIKKIQDNDFEIV